MCVSDPLLTAIQLFPMAKTAGKHKHTNTEPQAEIQLDMFFVFFNLLTFFTVHNIEMSRFLVNYLLPWSLV